ncbi:HAD family hydrolase [Candidatus Micrarchaeota archaeon]|nr:HAD family hydrolase [Candidatus Micrarchaeota archaeon]
MSERKLISGPNAPIAKSPLRDVIKHVFWDVDGTLFRKTSAVDNAQLLLLYNAFYMCRHMPERAQNPFDVHKNLVFPTLESVPQEVKDELNALEAHKDRNPNGKYKSRGAIFVGEFGKDQAYSPKVISTMDYGPILPRDERLIAMFKLLMERYPHIRHSLMSNDVRESTDSVFLALGLDISQFLNARVDELFPPNLNMARGSKYAAGGVGMLCPYNLRARKPSKDAFRQILEVAGMESEPERVIHIGDSEIKDVIPPKELGMTTVLVWTNKAESSADFNMREVYGLLELFER